MPSVAAVKAVRNFSVTFIIRVAYNINIANKIETVNNTAVKRIVSFYFIDKEFSYFLYATNKDKRWELKEYVPTEEDVAFAKRFIDWNNLDWGIQRVDACRSEQGRLLLVELEDLNPYLSLLELTEETRENFIEAIKISLQKALQI